VLRKSNAHQTGQLLIHCDNYNHIKMKMSYEDKSAIELLLNENWEMRKSLKMDRLCCTL